MDIALARKAQVLCRRVLSVQGLLPPSIITAAPPPRPVSDDAGT